MRHAHAHICQREGEFMCVCLCDGFQPTWWGWTTKMDHVSHPEQLRTKKELEKSEALRPRWSVVRVEEKRESKIKSRVVSHLQQQLPYRFHTDAPM